MIPDVIELAAAAMDPEAFATELDDVEPWQHASRRSDARDRARRLADAGLLAVSPPPRIPAATVAGVELDDAPLICEAGGCTRHPGHDGAHKKRDGAVTRRWHEGEVAR